MNSSIHGCPLLTTTRWYSRSSNLHPCIDEHEVATKNFKAKARYRMGRRNNQIGELINQNVDGSNIKE
jgi:hypothetical protein